MSEALYFPKETMKEESFLFEDEKNIRRGWHRAFLIYYLLITAMCFCNYFIIETPPMQVVMDFLSMNLGTFSLRYCAYSEFGTKLIGFAVILGPIRMVMGFFGTLFMAFQDPEISTLTHTGVVLALAASLFIYFLLMVPYVYFWIHCRRLYYVNKAIKKRLAA